MSSKHLDVKQEATTLFCKNLMCKQIQKNKHHGNRTLPLVTVLKTLHQQYVFTRKRLSLQNDVCLPVESLHSLTVSQKNKIHVGKAACKSCLFSPFICCKTKKSFQRGSGWPWLPYCTQDENDGKLKARKRNTFIFIAFAWWKPLPADG